MISAKNTIIAALATAALALPATVFALAGNCDNCHTMHNSQDGTTMGSAGYGTGNDTLLRASGCIGCHAHTGVNGSDGYALTGIRAPQVNDTTPNGGLGGGFFTTSGTDSQQHNVLDLHGADIENTITTVQAPGSGGAFAILNAGVTRLSCADTALNTGCHNTTGAHHNNTIGAVGTSGIPGDSFRFLDALGAGNWVGGVEGVNYGKDDSDVAAASSYTNLAAQTCAQCHGQFHNVAPNVAGVGSLAIWGLHPTEIDVNSNLPAGDSYNNGGVYNPALPMSNVTGTLGVANGTVMCLSCHRSHGSAYPDLLRWDYTTMVAGTGYAGIADTTVGSSDAGCFICHTTK